MTYANNFGDCYGKRANDLNTWRKGGCMLATIEFFFMDTHEVNDDEVFPSINNMGFAGMIVPEAT